MHLVCPSCGATNRAAPERTAEAVCGRCKTALAAPEPVPLSDAALPGYLTGSEQPVVVDFWAEWCGPCKMMAPQFATAARALPDVRFVKVDSDAAPKASVQYRIRSIPAMILFRGGAEAARVSGAMPASDIQRWIGQHIQGKI
jgi:thioredoxin 2